MKLGSNMIEQDMKNTVGILPFIHTWDCKKGEAVFTS